MILSIQKSNYHYIKVAKRMKIINNHTYVWNEYTYIQFSHCGFSEALGLLKSLSAYSSYCIIAYFKIHVLLVLYGFYTYTNSLIRIHRIHQWFTIIAYFFPVEEPLTKDNPHMDMEYWSHQQVLDFDHHTTAVTTTAEESLIPTLRKEVNSSIVTSAGQTVYLHCLVENLGERSVSEAILVR